MINESEMKTKKEKKKREMKFVCKRKMNLHLNREIRPNVVLEEHICAFGQKRI